MDNTIPELLLGYLFAGALIIGAPGVYFYIVFMPALQNTKGRMVGYKDHLNYGDSSIYDGTKYTGTEKFFLELSDTRETK